MTLSATADSVLINGSDLVIGYDGAPVVRGVDIRLHAGEVLALLGPNGCGKSTLVKALVGSLPLRSGTLEVLSARTARARRRRATCLGYVPQRIHAGGGISATALEVVSSGAAGPRIFTSHKAARQARLWLEELGLGTDIKTPVTQLSGGQQQRVLIARALLRQPRILVMDEPLAGIDAASAQLLANIIRTQKAQGVGVILVLHELGALESVIDRVQLLEAGLTKQVTERGVFGFPADALPDLPPPHCGETLIGQEDA